MVNPDQKLLLLVEDEYLIAMSEQMDLEKYGYKVILAHSGEEAIKTFNTNHNIDLIIMDIDLGKGIDGTEAAKIILDNHDVPILFMSSHMEPNIVEKTEKITSYGYVVKNSSITVLDASIKMAFKLFDAKKSEKLKENKIIEREQYLQSVFRAAPTGIGVVSNRILMQVNKRMCEITGYSKEELVGQSARIVYPNDEAYEFVGREKYRQIQKYGTGTVETLFKRKDNKIVNVLLSSTPLDINDLSKGVTFTALDITDRVEIENSTKEQNKFFNIVLDSLTYPFFVINANDYTVEKSNKVSKNYLDNNSKLCYKAMFNRNEPCNPPDQKCPLEIIKKNKQPTKLEYIHYDAEGNKKYVEVHGYPILDKNGNVKQMIEYWIDITERKQANITIENRVKELNSLNTINKIINNSSLQMEEVYQKIVNVLHQGFQFSNNICCEITINNRVFKTDNFQKTQWNLSKNIIVKEKIVGTIDVCYLSKKHLNINNPFLKEEDDLLNNIANQIGEYNESKLVEEKLKQYEKIVSVSTDMMALLDNKYNYLAVNKTYADAFNKTTDQFPEHTIGQIFGENVFNSKIKTNIDRCLKGKKINYQNWFNFPTYGKQYMDITYYPYYGKDNEIIGLVVNNRNITARKYSQQELYATKQQLEASYQQLKASESDLKESEKKYHALYDNAPLSYQSLNIDGCFIDINNSWLRTLGYEREEVIGKRYSDFLHPDWKQHFEKNFPAFKKRGYVHDVQFKIRHKDGNYIDISFEGCIGYHSDGSFKQTYCVFQDITDRKQKEDELRISNEQRELSYQQLIEKKKELTKNQKFQKAILNASSDILYIYDIENQENVYSNNGIIKILGYSVEEIQKMGSNFISMLMHPKDLKTYIKDIVPLYQKMKDEESVTQEYRMKHKNGQWYWLKSKESIFKRKKDGSAKQIFGLAQNITEQKKIEKSLKDSEEKYRNTLEAMSDSIHVIDSDFNIILCNSRFKELSFELGLGKNWIGSNLLERLPFLADKVQKEYEKLFHNGIPLITEETQCINNLTFITETRKIPLFRDEKVISIATIIRDITEKKNAESKIQNLLSEKEMLLKEVHHRVKNNMNVVKSLLYLQSKSLKIPEASEALQDAIGRIESMSILYDKLYKSNDYQEISIQEYLNQLINEIIRLFPNCDKVKVETKIDDFKIKGKIISPLGIMVNELITNSMKYAFPDNEQGLIQVKVIKEENHVTLKYKDNGIGISDTANKENHGFGFSLIEILVKQLHGKYNMKNENGLGYTFEFDI